METLPLHPKLVHLPIALAVLMPLIAGGLLVAWWRGALSRRTWLIAITLQAALVGSGFAAMWSGGEEEERVEAVVPEAAIAAHEDAADVFVWGAVGVLGLAIGAMLIRRERGAQVLAAVATVGTLAVLGLGYRVGQAGGRLVYEYGAASVYAAPPARAPAWPGVAPRKDDDD